MRMECLWLLLLLLVVVVVNGFSKNEIYLLPAVTSATSSPSSSSSSSPVPVPVPVPVPASAASNNNNPTISCQLTADQTECISSTPSTSSSSSSSSPSLSSSSSTDVSSSSPSPSLSPSPPSRPLSSPPQLLHLWTTPVLIVQPSLPYELQWHKQLNELALKTYELFQIEEEQNSKEGEGEEEQEENKRRDEDYRADSRKGLNERFFRWQQQQYHNLALQEQASQSSASSRSSSSSSLPAVSPLYLSLASSSAFQLLLSIFSQSIDHYFRRLGRSEDWLLSHLHRSSSSSSRSLFCWCTVQCCGSSHMRHSHPKSLVSGVYYSQIPKGAEEKEDEGGREGGKGEDEIRSSVGKLIFDDPRASGRAPFDGRYIHDPVEGDLLLFPSWLVHEVTVTMGKEKRISWSCSMEGDWEETTDVNVST